MKKISVIIIFTLIGLNIFAKKNLPTPEEVKAFLKTKTLIVLEDNPMLEFNSEIQEAIKANWIITEYSFISTAEFLQAYKDPNYSFLLLNQVIFQEDDNKPVYNYLSVWLGKDVADFEYLPEIVGVPLSYRSVDEENYIYKLGTIVRFIQNHIKLIADHPELIKGNIFEYYNRNMGDIKTKTLYLVADDLDKNFNTAEKIKKVYPYKFKITTRDDIQAAIERGDEDCVFLHKIGPEGTRVEARCYKIIVGARDANFYYFDWHMINPNKPDGFLESDFKKIAKKK
jgi:hypothetical protein